MKSPELIEKKVPTFKSDIYSFGVFIYELFEDGKVPFQDEKDQKVRKLVRRGTSAQFLHISVKSPAIEKLIKEW